MAKQQSVFNRCTFYLILQSTNKRPQTPAYLSAVCLTCLYTFWIPLFNTDTEQMWHWSFRNRRSSLEQPTRSAYWAPWNASHRQQAPPKRR